MPLAKTLATLLAIGSFAACVPANAASKEDNLKRFLAVTMNKSAGDAFVEGAKAFILNLTILDEQARMMADGVGLTEEVYAAELDRKLAEWAPQADKAYFYLLARSLTDDDAATLATAADDTALADAIACVTNQQAQGKTMNWDNCDTVPSEKFRGTYAHYFDVMSDIYNNRYFLSLYGVVACRETESFVSRMQTMDQSLTYTGLSLSLGIHQDVKCAEWEATLSELEAAVATAEY
ncbi:hypothetical protein MB02_13070 [Croceicoccus estronivorus]|uniref:hypothetical protein n=1 Tax=Croceicoccus estronivorus TaxID=1172626 RepID=UPI00082B8DEE|nr:hypothetical protein [Croceicoccus estronivorus]OCC23096.1 hypothetical protein MB02_13070 [Croceicoccus estronivorus]